MGMKSHAARSAGTTVAVGDEERGTHGSHAKCPSRVAAQPSRAQTASVVPPLRGLPVSSRIRGFAALTHGRCCVGAPRLRGHGASLGGESIPRGEDLASSGEAAPGVARAFGVRWLDAAFSFRARDRRTSRAVARTISGRHSPGDIASTFILARAESQSGVKPLSFPTSQRAVVQSQRDCVLQPRVARHELPWGFRTTRQSTPTGLWTRTPEPGRNPVGVDAILTAISQGSSCLATLGFGAESLWDSQLVTAKDVSNGNVKSPHSEALPRTVNAPPKS